MSFWNQLKGRKISIQIKSKQNNGGARENNNDYDFQSRININKHNSIRLKNDEKQNL